MSCPGVVLVFLFWEQLGLYIQWRARGQVTRMKSFAHISNFTLLISCILQNCLQMYNLSLRWQISVNRSTAVQNKQLSRVYTYRCNSCNYYVRFGATGGRGPPCRPFRKAPSHVRHLPPQKANPKRLVIWIANTGSFWKTDIKTICGVLKHMFHCTP